MIVTSRCFQTFVIYLSLLLDNTLLTVIVPILPDYLAQLNNVTLLYNIPNSVIYKKYDLNYVPVILGSHSVINLTSTNDNNNIENNNKAFDPVTDDYLQEENGQIGILLAAKALIQLIATPIVGRMTLRSGYHLPIVFGTFCLLIVSLTFAIGTSYVSLLFARSLQGIASACIAVCGMSLVAQLYPDDDKRSKVMGILLGSVALGVLIGYPFGGLLYDFIGKSAPFYIISLFVACNLVLQLSSMDLKNSKSEVITSNSKCCTLLSDGTIVRILIAIFISTTAMSVLEPCLPIWLMETLSPKKWQIGMVFIPDSIGYFLGANFFGTIAYHFGQIKLTIIAMIIVGISCFLIPNANSIGNLLLPHFGLGLGIGSLDAALVPMLATLVDIRYSEDESTSSDSLSNYGTVYAIQQVSVSLAYSLGPIIGGEIAQYIGFFWLMILIGSLNVCYAIYLFIYFMVANKKYIDFIRKDIIMDEFNRDLNRNYKNFYDSTTP